VTYLLDGEMEQEDFPLGRRGSLGPGDLQSMTAGRGIVNFGDAVKRDASSRRAVSDSRHGIGRRSRDRIDESCPSEKRDTR
jgi:hypothetical protein